MKAIDTFVKEYEKSKMFLTKKIWETWNNIKRSHLRNRRFTDQKPINLWEAYRTSNRLDQKKNSPAI